MNENSKNMMLAMALSMIVLVAWQYFYIEPGKHEAEKIVLEAKKMEGKKQDIAEKIVGLEPKSQESEGIKDRKEIISEETSRVKISSSTIHGSINLEGGRFDDLTLAEYRQELDKDSPEVVLLSPQGANDVYFAEFGWLDAFGHDIPLPGAKTFWWSDPNQKLTSDNNVTLKWDNGQGLSFIRKIELDKNYMFTITEHIENNSSKDVALLPYGLITRAREEGDGVYISHEGPLGVFDNILEEITYKNLIDEKKKEYKKKNGWLGLADKYWLTAIIPQQSEVFDSRFSHRVKGKTDRYQVDYLGEEIKVAAGTKEEFTVRFFAGAKRVGLLDSYEEKFSVPLFDHAVDYGLLYFLTKPMHEALKFFNKFLGNFGLAILMLTVIVKLLLFPLANKSYKSMAKMKKVQPEIMELRERFKDEKQKLAQETMKFYKERKINPAAGCLPVLIQIPIFFSLYKVLYISIEMRHAPFYGWIKDLSALDPTNIFNLFGLINWMPPAWLPHIGVLPIAFCVTMYVQQLLNPPPSDPTQAIVMRWLPVLFLFLFASFPAGLVIYWTWSNLLSIVQQYIITRSVEADNGGKPSGKEVAGNADA